MLNLSKEQTIEEHRKMWNWIADETEKRKQIVKKTDYFKEHPNKAVPYMLCYCCDFNFNYPCDFCPISWDEKILHYVCTSEYSLFYLWTIENLDYKQLAKYARQIANLPEREEL